MLLIIGCIKTLSCVKYQIEVIVLIISDINLEDLKAFIPHLLKRDLYKNRKIECCPCCGSVHFIKHGFFDGIQRYRCKDCKKTFSKTTNSLWYYSKKKSNLWIAFIELFLQRRTLRECSEELKMSLVTVFYWRHKVMNLLNCTHMSGINPDKLKGEVFITSAAFQETNYISVINFTLDYYWKEKRIFIGAAKGVDDSMLILPIGRNYFRHYEFIEKIYNKIDKKSYIVAAKNRNLAMLAERHNKKYRNKSIKSFADEARIARFENNAKEWFSIFKGIRTKYLEGYISYFILFNLDKCFKSLEFTYSLVEKFNFIRSEDIKFSKLSI